MHDTRPLTATHGAGPAVSEQIDQDIFRPDQEGIIESILEDEFSFFHGIKINGLNRFYSEWFYDCFHTTTSFNMN